MKAYIYGVPNDPTEQLVSKLLSAKQIASYVQDVSAPGFSLQTVKKICSIPDGTKLPYVVVENKYIGNSVAEVERWVKMFNDDVTKLRKMLNEGGAVTIVFTKRTTGEERIMHCTTNFRFIPVEDHPKTGHTGIADFSRLLKVYDLVEQGWRSVHADDIIEVC